MGRLRLAAVPQGGNPADPGGQARPYWRFCHRAAADTPAEGDLPARASYRAGRAGVAGLRFAGASIDEFIPFTFFHARSQLGERDVATDEYQELARQLRPY